MSFNLDPGSEQFVPAKNPPAVTPRIIDSFLVDDGRIRSVESHCHRFGRSIYAEFPATRYLLNTGDVESFTVSLLAALATIMPVAGQWFPRLEYYPETDDIRFLLRTAPNQRSHTALWVPETPDPRLKPRIKGWDLDELTALNATARRNGCDDALLVNPAGAAIETAFGALAVIVDGTICAAETGVLESVTWKLTQNLLPTTEACLSPQELIHYPVIVGNALHGWTEVPEILIGSTRHRLPTAPELVRRLNAALSNHAVDIRTF
ncbi:branched-chain amino acid aminotransferase/4-amino-4-deoxychorismate lyase [Corynebacterium mustelae]|uniref:Branched-chain amino acid aminotransferase/4-amino-4-deoxychorismate lyase n=1 Tax=Corynebacterium mustelae TaxID=571915 RepID=A0A0G3H2U4_9CORY|nr:aminotransferase class IV [Corynebacterium mustelae]AKK05452.1 branched-chain amino acid aminotransferase/4-amino-4-deoxychorismate lyase [Corynebacterium mustelae]